MWKIFVAARVLETDFDSVLRDLWPFVGVSIAGLVILYLAPGLSTWLPATMPRL